LIEQNTLLELVYIVMVK